MAPWYVCEMEIGIAYRAINNKARLYGRSPRPRPRQATSTYYILLHPSLFISISSSSQQKTHSLRFARICFFSSSIIRTHIYCHCHCHCHPYLPAYDHTHTFTFVYDLRFTTHFPFPFSILFFASSSRVSRSCPQIFVLLVLVVDWGPLAPRSPPSTAHCPSLS